MKKIIYLLLAIVFATSMLFLGIGCKQESLEETESAVEETESAVEETESAVEETESAVEETEEEVLSGTINAMAWSWSPGTQMEDAFAKFTEDTGIKVNLEKMDYGVYYQTVTARLTGGGDTDIVFQHAAPFLYTNASAGIYTPLEDFGIDSSFLFPVVRSQAMGKDGKTYIIPAGQNAMVLFINNKIMTENGWDYPTDWDSWMALCQKMVDKGIAPIYGNFPGNLTRYLWYPLEATKISYNEPDFWDKAKAGEFNPFADPRWKEIMQQEVYMWDNNYFDNETSPIKLDMSTEFGEGRYGMMLGGTFNLGPLRDFQNAGLDFKAVAIPCNDSDYPTNVAPVVAAVGWAAAKNTTKSDLVKAFELWWVDNVKNGVINDKYGWPPCVEGAPFKLFEEMGQTQIFDIFAGPTAPFTEANMPSIEIVDYVDKELQNVFLGTENLDDAIMNMQTKWDEVLANSNE